MFGLVSAHAFSRVSRVFAFPLSWNEKQSDSLKILKRALFERQRMCVISFTKEGLCTTIETLFAVRNIRLRRLSIRPSPILTHFPFSLFLNFFALPFRQETLPRKQHLGRLFERKALQS